MGKLLDILLFPVTFLIQIFFGKFMYEAKVLMRTEELLTHHLPPELSEKALADFRWFLKNHFYSGDEVGIKSTIRYGWKTKSPVNIAVFTLVTHLEEFEESNPDHKATGILREVLPLLRRAVNSEKAETGWFSAG